MIRLPAVEFDMAAGSPFGQRSHDGTRIHGRITACGGALQMMAVQAL